MNEPKPYDMTKPADRARWYREMKGYLSLQGEYSFRLQGTDRKGREFAWNAFLSIKNEFIIPDTLDELFQDLFALSSEVKPNNQDEFMAYFFERMTEFENRYRALQNQDGEATP